jgi:acetyl-CoA carboxylase, biotin carboxylase subunit
MITVLIANRGEIAVRIIRTCKKLGLRTVSVFSENDEGSLHVRLADESVCIGPRPAEKSYLNIESIVAAARAYHANLIHPGVGFLSENAAFRRACDEEGIRFIGPDADAMVLLEDKQRARSWMQENGFPVVPGSQGHVDSVKAALAVCKSIGFPVMLKAAKGGGGKGIRIISSAQELEKEFPLVSREAELAFGDKSMYIESYLPEARHIEVQILADEHGSVLHLGTRECSLQRKNQKLLEEAPAPNIDPRVQHKMEKTAVEIARRSGYKNAGTVEFLYKDGKYYFMEMNTRIQVEHPVTECVYGIDLIKAQIQVALSHHLGIRQEDIAARGHAIECRINAENIYENFRPSPGVIKSMRLPGGNGVRVDSGFGPGDEIPPYYDSMIMKIICLGDDRGEAVRMSIAALGELKIEGIAHNAGFTQAILRHPAFGSGEVHTKWIEQEFIHQFLRRGHESVQ